MKTLKMEDVDAFLKEADRRGVLPMFFLELCTGLRKEELVALLWTDLDIEKKTITVNKQAARVKGGGVKVLTPKTSTSNRTESVPQEAIDLLIQEHEKHPDNPYMFPSPVTGGMYYPDAVSRLNTKILKAQDWNIISRSAAHLRQQRHPERRGHSVVVGTVIHPLRTHTVNGRLWTGQLLKTRPKYTGISNGGQFVLFICPSGSSWGALSQQFPTGCGTWNPSSGQWRLCCSRDLTGQFVLHVPEEAPPSSSLCGTWTAAGMNFRLV